MSALKLLGKLLEAATRAGAVVDKVERVVQRITSRPPRARELADTEPPPSDSLDDDPTPPAVRLPPASAIYKDAHCWSREAPSEPPPYCYYCRQLKARASRYCPGVPPRRMG